MQLGFDNCELVSANCLSLVVRPARCALCAKMAQQSCSAVAAVVLIVASSASICSAALLVGLVVDRDR